MPWKKAQPYITGIQLGVILHLTRNTKVKINQILNIALWLCSAAVLIAVVYGRDEYEAKIDPESVSKLGNVFYGSLHKLAYSLALSWLVFACFHGYGGTQS